MHMISRAISSNPYTIESLTNFTHVKNKINSLVDSVSRCISVGNLFSNALSRKSSCFCIHPEKIKQIIKEKDAATLCNLFDSDDYKKKLVDFMNTKKGTTAPGVPLASSANYVKCKRTSDYAQTMYTPVYRPRTIGKAGYKFPTFLTKVKKPPKKTNAISVILNKKFNTQEKDSTGSRTQYMSGLLPIIMETRRKTLEMKKKYRKRSTIMPIFLRKLKDRLLQKDLPGETLKPNVQCAKQETKERYLKNYNLKPRNFKARSNYQNQMKENENTLIGETGLKGKFVSRLQNSPSRLQLVGYHGNCKSTSNLNTKSTNTSFSSKSATRKKKVIKPFKTEEIRVQFPTNIENKSRNKQQSAVTTQNTVPIKATTTDQAKAVIANKAARRKRYPTYSVKKLKPLKKFKKVQRLSESCEMNLPADVPPNMDRDLERIMIDSADLNKICRQNMSSFKLKETVLAPRTVMKDILTLFDRVKLDSLNRNSLTEENKFAAEERPENKRKREYSTCHSLTYEIVTGGIKRREVALKKQYQLVPKHKKSVIYKEVKLNAKEKEKRPVNKVIIVKKKRPVNKKLYKVLSQPPPSFADIARRNKNIIMMPHLIRLPKTTPEGYRVLMYSVRDNDPTKMNFNDCVKGFCMYNDCILSEDGLQEGYVVIFDMKGVQIGHLARVSLPALRCFMLYIQEAHPCRLKGIHILNTASWIHHIMRLVVPLVKSELLNLIKFHKGNIPEGLPLEILPMDLGGDAPTIDELDKDTKSMVHKYHEWLIETADFKSDESKRIKKASWWGFFNGTNKTNNVELDEKTILKNLQID